MANVLPDPGGNGPRPAWIPAGAAGAPFQPTGTSAADRDAAMLKLAAQQAELRRKALVDSGIARALKAQQAALRPAAGGAAPGGAAPGGDPGTRMEVSALNATVALKRLEHAAHQAYSAGAGAVTSLSAAAGATTAWPTLMASIEGVKIEMGQGFLPIINNTSMALQDMEHWLETVSPGTKEFGARLVIVGTAAAGVTYAVLSLVRTLVAMRTAAIAAWAAMTPAGAILGVIGLTAAVAGAAAAWKLTANNARDAGDAMDAAGRRGEAATEASHRLTPDEEAALPPDVRADIAGRTMSETRARVARERDEAARALEEEVARAPDRRAAAGASDRRDAELVRESMARRPDPGYSAADRERMREPLRSPGTSMPVWSPADIDAARELARRGRTEGRYGTDREEEEAASRFREMFTRARVGMPADGVNARRASDVPIRDAERRLRAAEAAATRVGARPGLTEDHNLPQARITDMSAMADAIQIKALEGKDKTNENLAKQLGVMGEMKTELVGMRADLATLRSVFPVSFGRWGRADEDPGRD